MQKLFFPEVEGRGIYHAPRPVLLIAAAQREETSVWTLGVWHQWRDPRNKNSRDCKERYPSDGIEVTITKQRNDHWGNS